MKALVKQNVGETDFSRSATDDVASAEDAAMENSVMDLSYDSVSLSAYKEAYLDIVGL